MLDMLNVPRFHQEANLTFFGCFVGASTVHLGCFASAKNAFLVKHQDTCNPAILKWLTGGKVNDCPR